MVGRSRRSYELLTEAPTAFDRPPVIPRTWEPPDNILGQLLETRLALAATEERAKLAARATQDLLYDWDLIADTIQWSEALADIFGYAVDELGTDYCWWLEHIHPDDRDRVGAEIDRCVGTDADRFLCEYRFRKADGSYADVYERGFIVREEGGRAIRMVGAMQDNTERNRAISALRQREADLTTVCSQAMVGIMHRRLNGDLLMVNQRFCEILGRSEGELRGLAVEDYTHPDDRLWNDAKYYQRIWAGDPLNVEKRYLRPDGSIVWCEVNVSTVEGPDGQPGSTIVVAQEITERREAELALRRSEERLRLVHEATGLADFESDIAGLTTGSDRFFEQFGLSLGDNTISSADWLKLVHPEDQVRLNDAILLALDRQDEWFSSEFRIIRADTGEIRWIACRTKMERNDEGVLVRTIGAHLDVTEQKLAEAALRESEERFRLAADASGLAVWDYDTASGSRESSDRLKEMLGLPRDAEPSFAVIVDRIHPDDRAMLRAEVARLGRNGGQDRFNLRLRLQATADMQERWLAVSGWKTIRKRGDAGRLIVTARDITEERTAEERIRWSASHDPLTALANRRLFSDQLSHAIREAAATGGSVGLLLLDMDNFKQINDSLGHEAGDTLLRMFAERLRSTVRAGDTVARFGGDEFAIVLPQLRGDGALTRLANAILDRLREPFVDGGRILDCRASIGASVYPLHGTTAEDLLKNADIALYAAKTSGRSRTVVYEPRFGTEVKRRSVMVRQAREAITDDRIVPYYQPKVDLRDGTVIGFETLLRLRNERGRIYPPARIEAAFQDLDVAAAISDRMIDRAIADMRIWLDRDVPFRHVALNASAAEFRRDDFAERVLEQLDRAGIATRHFQLEVTETVFLGRGAEYVHRALTMLSDAGVTIALDDFGTGYASLRHLKQFPVDLIKIDRSFVRDMQVDPGDAAIVRAVVNLGRSLGIQVVAEGIETREQLYALIALDCDFGQGYWFSKAVPAQRVAGLICQARAGDMLGKG